ncbi:TPA: type II secretion system protein GspM [Providencia rettgeri]
MKNNILVQNKKVINNIKVKANKLIVNYWNKKLPYEKIILIISLLIILLVGFYYIILNPINIKIQQHKYNLEQLQELNNRLISTSINYNLKNKKKYSVIENNKYNLSQIINQSAQKKGIVINQIKSTENQVELSIGETQFNVLLSWINQLSEQYNINISQINILSTNTPGVINIQKIIFSYNSL